MDIEKIKELLEKIESYSLYNRRSAAKCVGELYALLEEKPTCGTCKPKFVPAFVKSVDDKPLSDEQAKKLCCDLNKPAEPEGAGELMPMPKELLGKFHNACTDACDMLVGSCACGAWHHITDWVYCYMPKYLITSLSAENKGLEAEAEKWREAVKVARYIILGTIDGYILSLEAKGHLREGLSMIKDELGDKLFAELTEKAKDVPQKP